MEFEITENAFRRVSQIKEQERNKNLVLQISVRGGGCSGFMYNFELIEKYDQDFFRFSKGDSVIVVDRESALLLNGSKLDYVETLGSAGFEISNPNSTARCGCGNSFAV